MSGKTATSCCLMFFSLEAIVCILVGGLDVRFEKFRVFADDPVMCAVDGPKSSVVVRSQLGCSRNCLRDGNCTAFNYWNSTARCEQFDSLPCNYTQLDGCVHFRKHRESIFIQRNNQGKYSFNQSWATYKAGFSNTTSGDMWLGNDRIHNLTRNNDYKVRFEVQAKLGGKWYWAEYCTFTVANETQSYRLHVDQYTGTAGDAMVTLAGSDPVAIQWCALDGRNFTTYDRDFDSCGDKNCANYADNVGGFWYKGCTYAKINADNRNNSTHAMTWLVLPGAAGGLRNLLATRMLLLPKRV